MATALSGEFQTHSVFFGVGFIIPYIPSLSQRGIHTDRKPWCRQSAE